MTVKNKWSIFFITASSTALVFLDNTVMPVALPAIEKTFKLTNVGLLWVVNSYLLTLMALFLAGGRLTDIFGKRSLYFFGFSLFGLGSIMAALSFSGWWLILSRVVQGIGGSCMVPATGSLLISSFPPGQRGKALGINTGISSLFLILGPAVGGFFTYYLSWHYIFWINIPIVAFGLWKVHQILPKEEKGEGHFHFSGALLLVISLSSLVVAIMQGPLWGWSSPLTLSLFAVFLLFFLLFFWVSKRAEHPIIDFSMFRLRFFRVASYCIFFTQNIVMVTVLWAIYFQDVLQFNALEAGLLILISTSPVIIMAPLGGYLSDHFSPKLPMLIGFTLLLFSLLWLHFTREATAKELLPGLLAFGCGIPMIYSPAIATAMSEVEPKYLGSSSSLLTTIRQVASTIGLAVLTAVSHTSLEVTGSEKASFSFTLLFTSFFAIAGIVVVLLRVKWKKAHLV